MDKAIEILEVLIKNSKTSGSEIELALAEIKKEKMKTCTSCKYGHLDSNRYLPVHKCDLGCNSVDFDFCCNRHKYKEKHMYIAKNSRASTEPEIAYCISSKISANNILLKK